MVVLRVESQFTALGGGSSGGDHEKGFNGGGGGGGGWTGEGEGDGEQDGWRWRRSSLNLGLDHFIGRHKVFTRQIRKANTFL